MRLPVCGLIAGALLALAGPAAADDFDTCYEATGDVAIAACDRAIASGRYSGTKLSQLYNNRGAEYRKKAEYGRAVADSSEAIRLDPNNAPAYAQRGTAYYKAGQSILQLRTSAKRSGKIPNMPSRFISGAWPNESRATLLAATPTSRRQKRSTPTSPR